MFIISVICVLLIMLSTNFLGLYISPLKNKVLHWSQANNPFIILAAFSLFNIFRNKSFINNIINKWSSLTLLIYIIHENILVRTYLRPYIFVFIKDNFGYDFIILKVLLYAIVLFLISSLIALIYSLTIQKITKTISIKITGLYEKYNDKLLDKLEKIN